MIKNMATSESDDFESADEELNVRRMNVKTNKNFTPRAPSTINSESDDDVDNFSPEHDFEKMSKHELDVEDRKPESIVDKAYEPENIEKLENTTDAEAIISEDSNKNDSQKEPAEKVARKRGPRQTASRTKKPATKLGFRLGAKKVEHLDESEMPEELKSNLTFSEVFKTEGWEGFEDDVVLAAEESSQPDQSPVSPSSDKVSPDSDSQEISAGGGWSSWGSWGVSSLINTATASVSTLTNTMSQGLTLLEGTMGAPDPVELAKRDALKSSENQDENIEESPQQDLQFPTSYMFSNLMSGVTSITKLVESTSNKVISGGLDTLEVIGKKTMEVLQEGDPGLKKKRAFFLNEVDKPILSQILREAKEKADTEEKSLEERELARKVHFESLFDDYQGLVHLEALEMLSKQSNIKIEHRLIDMDEDDLNSMQTTLEEIRELCDLGDEDEEEEDGDKRDLKERLDEVCKNLGIGVSCDKLYEVLEEIKNQFSLNKQNDLSHRQIFQQAISVLAQFTAYSVERFHKSAELLLVKERRNTVNEADALVQLTRILREQISDIANKFCDRLNDFKDDAIKDDVNCSITTIFLEAANASSYIYDAFRLLIPILQVGAL